MKYLIGFVFGLIVMVGLNLLSRHALTFTIPQFFIGWCSCCAYYGGKMLHENIYTEK